MNDLSTSTPSKSLNTWRSLPWGTFLFLLAVFVLSTPLISFGLFWRPAISFDDALGVADVMHRDNWTRILALIALGTYALFNLFRYDPGRFQINGPLGWLILFYLTWAAVSTIWSVDPRFTLKRVGISMLLSLGALYAADRISLRETKALVIFICSFAVLIGFLIVVRTQTFFIFQGHWRFGGNMHPISQAWHCGLLFLAALASAKTAKQKRAVYIGIAIIAFLFLTLTRSRVAFVATFIGAAVFLGLVEKKRYRGVLFFLGIMIGGSLLYFYLGNEFLGVGEKVVTLGRLGETQTTYNLTGRVPLWKAIMGLVKQRPLGGYGYDSFLTGQNLVWVAEETGWATNSPHSGYMATLGGLGFIGFVPLVFILILSVTKSIRLTKQNPEYAFMAAVIVWLIVNLYTEDAVLTRPFFPVFVWMTMLAKLGFIREES